jgi:hypothetical protein
VKQHTPLTVTSLLTILFLSLHITSDFIHNAGELSLRGIFIVAVFLGFVLYGTLFLGDKRSGHVIMLIGALAALGMPVIHLMTERGLAGAIDRPYAFIFVWGLLCLAVTGLFSLLLAIQGLVRLQRGPQQ